MDNTTRSEALQAVEKEIQFRERYADAKGLSENEREALLSDVAHMQGWLSDQVDQQLGAVLDAHFSPVIY